MMFLPTTLVVVFFYSEYTFPFEGNWNVSWNIDCWLTLVSEYTFPFEGNWNWSFKGAIGGFVSSEYTFPFEGNWNFSPNPLLWRSQVSEYTFPFEGNWNSINAWRCRPFSFFALNTLSRLKGIETICLLFTIVFTAITSEYTFPFEGNWNLSDAFSNPSI